jgi:hypothetical protein
MLMLRVKYLTCVYCLKGHAVAQWLRRYVTNRKVAGSRPDEVNVFYQFTNPSGPTKSWGLFIL